jgi:protein-S-isoprenylcysteine O-methyltransferase Ste14
MYGLIALAVQYGYLPQFRFVLYGKWVSVILGATLIPYGVPVFVVPALFIDRYFRDGRLCTQGIYAYVRHPIYAAWIVLIVPGLTAVLGSAVGWTVPVVMYAVFRWLIVRQERYLEAKLGDAYRLYRSNVNSAFPRLKRKKHQQ